jgi:hypothetical protein
MMAICFIINDKSTTYTRGNWLRTRVLKRLLVVSTWGMNAMEGLNETCSGHTNISVTDLQFCEFEAPVLLVVLVEDFAEN